MTDPMRALFLAPNEPWCRENGTNLIIADMLQALAGVEGAAVLPVFLGPGPRKCLGPATVCATTLGIEPLPKWLSLVWAAGMGRSPWDTRFRNRAVAKRVEAVARERGFSPSVVHVEHLDLIPIGLHVAVEFGVPVVYRGHNIESQLWSRRIGTSGWARGWLGRRLEHHEARGIGRCAAALCISDVDADWVRRRVPGVAAEVLPAALLMSRYQATAEAGQPMSNRICFVGGLDWAPNENGLRWFLESVLPLVLEERPEVEVAILARGAESRPWVTSHPAVRLMSQEMEPPALFASSRLSLAPLLEGGGVRIKILESLAVGCPAVATVIGGEGLSTEGLRVADDPSAFAEACLQVLEAPPDRLARDRWRRGLEESHSAESVALSLVEAWRRVAAV